MSTLDQLLSHAGYNGTRSGIFNVIEESIRHQPRSMQKLIGPSEIGTRCTHCLAAKLSGDWAETERGVPWLPFIGTAVHAALAEFFEADNKARGESRWLVEHRVNVGQIGGHSISGTCDLFDTEYGTVVDFKIVGVEALRSAKANPRLVYQTQVQLYGRGYENAGHTPTRVMIAHLPRNAVSLSQAVIWEAPYDSSIALSALERANRIHANLTALASISTEVRDAWITDQPRADGCFSCPRYPDWTTTSQLASELGITTSTTPTDRKAA